MPLDQLLIEVLVDPEDKKPLWYFDAEQILYNPRLRRRYEIREGIPILLISEGVELSDAEHQALVDRVSEAIETGSGEPPRRDGEGAPGA